MSSANIAQTNEHIVARSRRSPLRAFEESRFFSLTLLLPILIFFVALNV
ncbi:MAG TPA: sugar ABC transporter permease, partial [Chloroflexi bacterium]|nr:sugar ABC transporter permease [Chloroflexota bacterium]